VTITGTGFTGTGKTTGDFVEFGSTATTFTVTGDTKITAKVPTTLAAGSYTISVKNAAGTATSATDFVVVVAAPTITSFTPSDGPASAAAPTAITVTGTGFLGTNKVTVNGKAQSLVSVNSDTELMVTVGAGTTSGPITITTPAGTATTTGGVGCGGIVGSPTTTCTKFTVDPPPHITSFTPSAGIGETVTITGTGFLTTFNGVALDNDTSVSFNGTDAPGPQITCGGISCPTSTPTSATTVITVDLPDGATSGPITVTNGHGESFTTTSGFTVIAPPSITSFSPTSGSEGDTVTITGSHFSGATEVDFNGTPATTFSVDSDTQITATVPTGATTGKITVTRPHGSGTSSGDFTVTA
jgi:large repetitive protein